MTASTWRASVPPMTERDFQATVVETARLLGWRVYHTHDSRRSEPGFPDLVLVRERVVWAELKTDSVRSRLTPEQRSWVDALQRAGGEVHVWRPRDWPLIEQTLRDVA